MSLAVALAVVLFMRRSVGAAKASGSIGGLTRRVFRYKGMRKRTAPPVNPPQTRQRLVAKLPLVPVTHATQAAAAETPTAQPPLDPAPGPDAVEFTADVQSVGDIGPATPVDAPGWPSPGELAGMYQLDDFDPIPPTEAPDAAAGTERAVDTGGAAVATASDWVAPDHVEYALPEPRLELSEWDNSFEREPSDDDAAIHTVVEPADASAWGDIDEDPAEAIDGEQSEWQAKEWEWESQDDPVTPSRWTDPQEHQAESTPEPQSATADAVPERAVFDAGEPAVPDEAAVYPDLPGARGVNLSAPTDVSGRGDPSDPVAGYGAAIAAALRPLLAATAKSGVAPVIVIVVTPEVSGPMTPREAELARTVRDIEKRLTALSRPGRAPAKRPTYAPGKARPASAARTNQRARAVRPAAAKGAPFKLTAVEERTLRALAARRSAPIGARRRARIVLATARGQDVAGIAVRVGVHASTVRRWQSRFRTDRLAALAQPACAARPNADATITHHE